MRLTPTPPMLSRPPGAGLENAVDEPVLDGLRWGHEPVAVDVLENLLHGPSRVAGDDLGHSPAHLDDLERGDLDVARRPARARRALVDHHLGVGKTEALAGRPA